MKSLLLMTVLLFNVDPSFADVQEEDVAAISNFKCFCGWGGEGTYVPKLLAVGYGSSQTVTLGPILKGRKSCEEFIANAPECSK